MTPPPLLVPVIMIVAGLAVFALLLRQVDVHKRRGGTQRLDELTSLLDEVRARVDGGEQVSPTMAMQLRNALISLLDTLAENAEERPRARAKVVRR